MYNYGQVIYDLDKQEPFVINDVWNPEDYPKRHTHFIKNTGQFTKEYLFYEIALPKTVEEAKDLLAKNLITPSACPPTHCYKCQNWLTNHNKDGSCWE
jgi:hypothetical protein